MRLEVKDYSQFTRLHRPRNPVVDKFLGHNEVLTTYHYDVNNGDYDFLPFGEFSRSTEVNLKNFRDRPIPSKEAFAPRTIQLSTLLRLTVDQALEAAGD